MNVLLVDQHPIFAAGLQALLELEPDVRVVGRAASTQEAVCELADASIDLVVISTDLADGDGLELVAHLSQRHAALPVILVLARTDSSFVESALDAGATAYLTRRATREEISAALRALSGGASYIQAEITRSVLETLRSRVARPTSEVAELWVRELEVLRLAARGLKNAEIGSTLAISLSTVKTHVRSLYKKLDVADRTQLALLTAQKGLAGEPVKRPT